MRSALLILFSDIVIFQKTYSRYHLLLMRYAISLGKSAYLDIDDAPSRTGSTITLNNFGKMARMATGVFVGSSRLFDFVETIGGSPHFIPSGIRLENYHIRKDPEEKNQVCIGWIGNGIHYSDDLLEILTAPLTILAEHNKLKFLIVGSLRNPDLHKVFDSIKYLEVDFIDDIDWADPGAVSTELGKMDIGVYPLLTNEFNEFKCGFKALEYMACGIPVVATPNEANKSIISADIDGYFASSDDQWHFSLQTLIADSQLRKRMGARGRSKVEIDYSMDCIAEKFRTVFLFSTTEDIK